jgi:hypothetical protein
MVSDPYNLPRWWPRTARVEAVEMGAGGFASQWTQVLETVEGRSVRADFQCLGVKEGEGHGWTQRVEGTPFERHLRNSSIEIALEAAGAETDVTIVSEQSLRGLSRLGSVMMRRGQGKIVEEALDGMEQALSGEAPSGCGANGEAP